MKRVFFTVFLVVVGVSVCLGSVKEDLVALNRQLEAAYLAEDIDALEYFLSEDHIHNNVFGMMMDKERFLSDIREGVLKFEKYETPELDIKVFSDTAILTGFIEAEANRSGRKVEGRFLFTRIYAMKEGRWQVVHFHNTKVPDAS